MWGIRNTPLWARGPGADIVTKTVEVFEIPAERSELRPDFRKDENEKLSLKPQNGLPEFLVEALLIF